MFKYLKNSFSRIVVTLASVSLLLPLGVAHAVGSTQFTDPNPENGDQFGFALSISQDGMTAVVGSPNSTVGGNSLEGTAYVFENNGSGWGTPVAQLTPSDGANNARFGTSVSLVGSAGSQKIIVGAINQPPTGSSTQGGEAYIYDEPAGGWGSDTPTPSETAKLAPSDSQAGDNFGISTTLSADGSTAVIGANHHAVNGNSNQGEAYVFTDQADSWNQGGILTASNGTSGSLLASSVAVDADGSSVLVGAPAPGSSSNGKVYSYERPGRGWSDASETASFQASDASNNDNFGTSVALTPDGMTAVVGAPLKTVGSNQLEGAAYVFNNSGGGWSQSLESTNPANDAASSDFYGYSVAIANDGSSLLVGAPRHTSDSNSNEGAVYQFNPDGNGSWVYNQEITPGTPGADQNFGWATFAISSQVNGNVFVGAPALTNSSNTSAGTNNASRFNTPGQGTSGRAYQFNLAPSANSVSPSSGAWGDKVTISGSGFSQLLSVDFNGTPASVTSSNSSQIKTTVPTGATSGPITIKTRNGSTTIPFTVTLPPAPTISSVKSNPADEGDSLTIKGSNLTAATVTLNSQTLTLTKDTGKVINVNLPNYGVSGTLTVTTPSGSTSTSLTVAAPSVKSVPKSGSVGSTITIKGAGLAGVTSVQFGSGASAAPTSASDKQLTVVVPAGGQSGPITVTAPSGQGVSAKSFTVTP